MTSSPKRSSSGGTATGAPASLGGMDMLMSVHIDDAVRLRADLSPDRSSRVELEGGGDLNLQYTPQGDLTLSGRYTFDRWYDEICPARYPVERVPVCQWKLCGLDG